ncbi:MAG: 4-(cytidine 5'-diphospho)-2-C-methyl-D-erythritol kinase [Xanthobacteraceae bacterium]|nr:4-(cytidine 5'-diphospho)-2-C-methyl-D-erythritol kinase [Xanthobacteraceae bacterium]
MAALVELAPAKVNLTLAVLGRRADGYHLLDSLVVFAGVADRLTLAPGPALSLKVRGETAAQAGPLDDNLVLKAARALAGEVPGLKLGRFTLEKRLPVAAGLGGGSSDAAAALRLLAKANRFRIAGAPVAKIAPMIGADVPVCVDPRPRRMRGIGEVLSAPLGMPKLAAVMVNPGVAVPTRDVFMKLGLKPGGPVRRAAPARALPRGVAGFVEYLSKHGNDLQAPAIEVQPVVARVLADIRESKDCLLARMSGSGATCFGIFASPRAASVAARSLSAAQPKWWVRATTLG